MVLWHLLHSKTILRTLCTNIIIYWLGLILVPNGKLLGKQLGDKYPYEEALANAKLEKEEQEQIEKMQEPDGPGGRLYGSDYEHDKEMATSANFSKKYGNTDDQDQQIGMKHEDHPWGIFFTVLGTVLLDFDADACQSPSRAYLLDVTVSGMCNVGIQLKNILWK